MAENKEKHILKTLGTVFTGFKWFFSILIVILLFLLMREFYPIAKDCWTCYVFESLYNAFSKISLQTFQYFQDKIVVVVSVCLSLWVVYETYKLLMPSVLSVDAPNIGPETFKTIYKKIFLTIAIFGLFIFNNPRNIFANTFEITLDFGSGIGREFIRKKMINKSNIPQECKNTSNELIYKEGMALSENTKNNMVCLLKEVHLLHQEFIDIGISLFEYGAEPIRNTIIIGVSTKLATVIGGFALKKVGKKLIKSATKNIKRIDDLIEKAEKNDKPKDSKKFKEMKEESQKQINNAKKAIKGGDFIQEHSTGIALIAPIISFFTNEDVRMGIAGIGLILGFIYLNLFFSFIIVENILFLGVSIILLPILAGCYIFDQTRQFSTVSIKQTFSFAIGLIFMCIGMVICAEINDFILGGMFSAPDNSNISNTQYALSVLRNGDIEEFNNLVGSGWFFVYVLITLGLDYLIMKEMLKIASKFKGGSISSDLVKPLANIGKSTMKSATSVIREVDKFVSTGYMSSREKGDFFDSKLFKKRHNKKIKKDLEKEENEIN